MTTSTLLLLTPLTPFEKNRNLKKVLFIYLLLNPNSITPTLLLHNTTCLFTATYSPRIRDDDVNVNNKTATTGCSVLSLLDRREKNSGCLLTLNHVKSSSIVQRATEWIYNDQKVTTKKSENSVIISLRATLYCNKLTRARRSVTHTHDAFKQQRVLVLRRRKVNGHVYISSRGVSLSLWYVVKKTRCLLLSPCTDTRGSASKRNESAGAKRPLARATLPHKINERERRRNRAAIGCEMCFFF